MSLTLRLLSCPQVLADFPPSLLTKNNSTRLLFPPRASCLFWLMCNICAQSYNPTWYFEPHAYTRSWPIQGINTLLTCHHFFFQMNPRPPTTSPALWMTSTFEILSSILRDGTHCCLYYSAFLVPGQNTQHPQLKEGSREKSVVSRPQGRNITAEGHGEEKLLPRWQKAEHRRRAQREMHLPKATLLAQLPSCAHVLAPLSAISRARFPWWEQWPHQPISSLGASSSIQGDD